MASTAAQNTGTTKLAMSTPKASVTITSRNRNPAAWIVRCRMVTLHLNCA